MFDDKKYSWPFKKFSFFQKEINELYNSIIYFFINRNKIQLPHFSILTNDIPYLKRIITSLEKVFNSKESKFIIQKNLNSETNLIDSIITNSDFNTKKYFTFEEDGNNINQKETNKRNKTEQSFSFMSEENFLEGRKEIEKNLSGKVFVIYFSPFLDDKTVLQALDLIEKEKENNNSNLYIVVFVRLPSNSFFENSKSLLEDRLNFDFILQNPSFEQIRNYLKSKIISIAGRKGEREEEEEEINKLAMKFTGLKCSDVISISDELKCLLSKSYNKVVNNYINNWNDKQINQKNSINKKLNEMLKNYPINSTNKNSVLLKPVTSNEMGGYQSIIKTISSYIQIRPFEIETYNKNGNMKMGHRYITGILLEGPPGTGKTMLVRRIAHETQRKLVYQKTSSLLSSYLGESERAIRNIFSQAKELSPSILFFDEIESLLTNRFDNSNTSAFEKRLLATFLTEMDSLKEEGLCCAENRFQKVVVFGTTNKIEMIDAAFLRKGRIDMIFHIGLLNSEIDVTEIVKIHSKGLVMDKVSEEMKKRILNNFLGKSAADISNLFYKLKMFKLKKCVSLNNFENLKFLEDSDIEDFLIK